MEDLYSDEIFEKIITICNNSEGKPCLTKSVARGKHFEKVRGFMFVSFYLMFSEGLKKRKGKD